MQSLNRSKVFCLFNNVAVAAAVLKTAFASKGIKKIMILDW